MSNIDEFYYDELKLELRNAEDQIAALKRILAEREHELLMEKGPCSSSNRGCVLHFAHSGPCNIKEQT